MNLNNTFGNKLNHLKMARGWSSAELAQRAGISQGLLSGLIHNQRIIGEITAMKIGKALQLTGNEMEDFIYSAINCCSEKVLNSFKAYPAEVINLVADELNALGVSPSKIARCVRESNDATILYFDDGKRMSINVAVSIQ